MADSSAPPVATIKLPAELGIEGATDLHRELVAHVDDAVPVVLDAADVSRIHTAALQLFCLFCRDRQNGGRETHWRAPSIALKNAAVLLGVTQMLNLGQEAAR
ncbi:MAG TPA: STAS domain-containing protein [Nevskiaceae bacterium]|nr:STAS domain-containing protein [Nevskiaceae bacterium]